jgi:tyrosine-protein kinase Etk/Wzc
MKNTAQSTNVTNPFEGTTSKNAVSAIAFRYLPFWPIFVFTIVVSLSVSYFYIHYQTPIYEAGSTILLKDSRGADGANVLEALGLNNGSKTVENEIEVLKSRVLMEQVVKDLGLYAQVYNKGALRDILIYPNPVKFIALNPEDLQNSPNLPISFEYLPTDNYITISGKKYALGLACTHALRRFYNQPA